jgi:hypothetical protein
LDTSFFNNRNIMKNLDDAIGLAEIPGHVFVATADSSGMPHVAAAAQIKRITGAGGQGACIQSCAAQ